MKILIKIGNGPTRSLNRILCAILAIIISMLFFMNTVYGIDAEIAHNDLVVKNFLKSRK